MRGELGLLSRLVQSRVLLSDAVHDTDRALGGNHREQRLRDLRSHQEHQLLVAESKWWLVLLPEWLLWLLRRNELQLRRLQRLLPLSQSRITQLCS